MAHALTKHTGWRLLLAGALLLVALLLLWGATAGQNVARATFACPPYASEVIDYSPGTGFAGSEPQNNPNNALGVEDGLFVSLGQGGSITLKMAAPVTTGIVTVEAFGGDEGASVEVSEDGVSFTFVGDVLGTTTLILPPGMVVNYVRITDDGSPVGPSQSPGYDLDSVGTPCGPVTQPLVVTKDAHTSLTRTYTWEIAKSVAPSSWDLFTGDSGTSQYTVSVDKTVTDSDWAVTGTITVQNPNPDVSATITSVADSVDGIPAAVDCGVGFPFILAGGATLTCSYSTGLPDGATRTNTATVSTSGAVGGGSGTATVDFASATVTEVGYPSINVDDTNGGSWMFSDDGSASYAKTFTCDADAGAHNNTATILETGQSASASVAVNCYALEVTKDASVSSTRTYRWSIEKSADKSTLTLDINATANVSYSVMVTMTGFTDSGWVVSGSISVHNPAPMAATINGVSDIVSGVGAASVSCGVSFPYSLASGGTLVCTYSAALPDTAARINTATASLQNYAYASDGSATPSGTTGFSGSAAVDFSGATVSEVDKCITVSDTFAGVLGTVCYGVDALPKTFTYSRTIGPYAECGDYTVDNTAFFVAADTQATGSSSWNVRVTVPCVVGCSLTPGYWKTHSKYGPAPYDSTWAKVMPSGEDSIFYLSGKTYYQVLWTKPSGGNAYYILAHAYIAAYLNHLSGADTSAISAQLSHAQSLLSAYKPTDKLSKSVRADFISTADILDQFNNGLIGPGHCSS